MLLLGRLPRPRRPRRVATLVVPHLRTMQDEVLLDNADYDHGGPKHRGFTLNGDMHGTWKFYRRDGSLMRSGDFDQGQQVGIWRTFDRSGAVVKETDFPLPSI